MGKVKFIIKNVHRIPLFLKKGIACSKLFKEYIFFNIYEKQFLQYVKEHAFQNQVLPGESEYIKKWSRLDSRVEPYSFRFFSHYMSEPQKIIPEAIGHLRIEEIINNQKHKEFYSDKNCYDLYMKDIRRPKTLLRRCGDNHLLDASFKKVADIDTVMDVNTLLGDSTKAIMKPSTDSNSGIGVVKLVKNSTNQWMKHNRKVMTIGDLGGVKTLLFKSA